MPAQVIRTTGARQHKVSGLDAVCVVLLLAYFLHFALPALTAGFGDDEMMNLYLYWLAGVFKSIQANLCFWSTFPRPAGAIYYLPLYHFFSLNPLPYRIVQISVLAVTIPIFFCLAQLLSRSRAVAFLAALAMCYHAEMARLVFTGSFIYDVLCGFFYFAALTYYINIRQKDLALSPVQSVVFVALYICALNSKEMAVSLPVIVVLYEVLKCPRFRDLNDLVRRNWRVAIPAFVAALVTAIYICGKLSGANSLAKLYAYKPVYSLHRFTLTNAHFINDLFYRSASGMGRVVLVAWPVLFLYAFWRRDRLLQLMAFWVVITPLPLAFIPGRTAAMYYIALFGWATIFARLVSDLIGFVCKVSPISALRTAMLRTFATAAVAVGFALFTDWQNHRLDTKHAFVNAGEKSLLVIQAFRGLALHPERGSRILLRPEKRFYQNAYYPLFVASLLWNDHSLRIYVEGQQQLTERDIAQINYVISFDEFHARVLTLRSPTLGDAHLEPSICSVTDARARAAGPGKADGAL